MVIKGGTDIGLVRSSNQDSYYISPDGKWFIVSDGMGGHNGGETASKMAVEAVKSVLMQQHDEPLEEIMRSAIVSANTAVYEKSLSDPSLSGMGTTVVLCCFSGDREALIAHVGDSRAYIISENEIRQITKDHSIVQNLLDSGTITSDQAQNHPSKNQITRAVGTERSVVIDINAVKIKKGDLLLLCTDGLTTMVSESTILTEIRSAPPEEAVRNLIQYANNHGGYDNTTVVLAEI